MPMLIAVAPPCRWGIFVSFPSLNVHVPIDFGIVDERIPEPNDDNV